jgi:hypothetical protein
MMDNQNYIILRNSNKGDAYSASHDLDDKVDALQAKLDEKDKELEALRGFAIKALTIEGKSPNFENFLIGLAKRFKLIDENGNPTKLLKGE